MKYRPHLAAAALFVVSGAAILGCGSSSSNSGQSTTASSATPAAPTTDVKTASTSLGTVLVDSKGMTLYHLTAEKNGKFICTDSTCMGLWHPLMTHGGQRPHGSVGSLSTVQRPDGQMQITYKGQPLYTFVQDTSAGSTKGQGFKDVGTWTVIKTKGASAPAKPPAAAPSTSTSSSGSGGYGY
ncbi:MAG: hypothetical protein ACJ77M_14805 [Thermoleophilaceae bacterium]